MVVGIYAALAALMTVLWFLMTGWRGAGAYLVWGALLLCRLFLGGYYSQGLVKPFNGRAPQERVMPTSLLLLKLRVYPQAGTGDEVSFRNDERELAQRDRAHYMAYQAVGLAGLAPWMLSSLRMTKPGLTAWIPMGTDQLYFGLTTVVLLLFLTLPQAILLWTEPDMEAEGDGD